MTSDSPAPAAPLVSLRGVTKRFGATTALDAITLDIHAGRSHAVAGRNGAGKSTVVSILTGLIRPDEGEVMFSGRAAPTPGELQEWRRAVACVYQHSMTIPELTVAENLFLNDYHGSGRWVSWRRLKSESQELLERWGLAIDPRSKASDLSVGNRQLVEIARALRSGSRFVILDEPTAQLETKEIRQLFDAMNRLQDEGVTFLFISHHLHEIYEVCQDVSVFRDGHLVVTATVEEMDQHGLVRAMVGDSARTIAPTSGTDPGPLTAASAPSGPALEVKDLTIEGACTDVSFTVYSGEVVGLAGLGGSGKLQVSRAIAGMLKRAPGTVRLNGEDIAPNRVDRAIESGLGYVPEDRRSRGYCENLTTEENVTLPVTKSLSRSGIISGRGRRATARKLIDDFEIVPSDPRFLTANMSGGNQQKSVVARASASGPRVLLLVTPTAGVDVASKEALFSVIQQSTAGVLLVSDELDELAICDRILVMFDGRVVSELGRERTDRDVVAAMEGVTQ